ncbi:MAG: cobalt ECF transporter T component CbiQ [Bacteroidetes bacterium]|nr:cobalt ECF transporter T component CbiQ [Bacteroidota bacterium]
MIDRYAYATKTRMVDPAHKAALAVSVMVLCLALDKPAVGLLAALGMWGMASCWAAIPFRVFAGVLMAEAAFLLMATVGVAISVGTAYSRSMWGFAAGPWWVGTDRASLELAAHLVTRALGSASALNFLALTTPLVDLLEVMRRLRLPPLLTDVMMVVYRFTFTLLESLVRMHTAQESRLGYVNFQRGMVSAGLLAGGLFVDSCRRTSRLQTALESRGHRGELRVLSIHYRSDPRLYWAGAILLGSLFFAWSLA